MITTDNARRDSIFGVHLARFRGYGASRNGGITVHYVRAHTRDDLDRLLCGATFNELSPRAIVDHGSIIPPDGLPLKYSETGYPAIASFEEAVAMAKATRTNPKSILVEKGFAPDTPINFFIAVRKADQIE